MKKIKFNAKAILPQLAQVVSVVSSKNAMPILANVMFETQDSGDGTILVMTASDSETWVEQKVKVEGDTGVSICVDAQDIMKGLRNLDDVYVELEIDEESQQLTCRYGKGYFSITYLDTNEFPRCANSTDASPIEYVIPSTTLREHISSVGFAVNDDELRPVFNSIHFDFFDDGMVVVATDGQRLAKIKDYTIHGNGNELNSFNLPTKPANILLNILSCVENEIVCKFDEKEIVFKNKDFKLSTRLIEGRYPNYDSVIPKESKYESIIEKATFVSSIKRVAPMGNNTSELMKLAFDVNTLVISAENIDFCKKAEETIMCQYLGDKMAIGFKSSYLLQSLQNINSENIEMRLIANNRACVLVPHTKKENVDYTYLLMPLLLD